MDSPVEKLGSSSYIRNEKLPATQQSQIENLKSKTASHFHGQPTLNLKEFP
ncbi:hypothetical protein Q5691_12575 [Microcoleus sp. w1-18aA5]|uniref:hypothetical protein n=1 Tax=unclassified Microcoleus TaxID=2642155 RepID=UPI002FCE8D92